MFQTLPAAADRIDRFIAAIGRAVIWLCLLLVLVQFALVLLRYALGIGSIFLVVKAFEYGSLFTSGISPVTNDFFMYYFVLTGLHLLHYLGGMVALVVTLVRARKHGLNAGYTRWIESVGVYWHMVDLIWIFLFPMLYLLRAA